MIRKGISELLTFVLDFSGVPTEQDPTPFAQALKEHVQRIVLGWMEVLADCFTDGVVSVQKLFKTVISNTMANISPELAPLLPMGSSMISSFLMRSYNSYQQTRQENESENKNQWKEYLSAEEMKEWQSVIDVDVEKQRKQTKQRPFSNGYKEGASHRFKRGRSSKVEGEDEEEKERKRKGRKRAKLSRGLRNILSLALTRVDAEGDAGKQEGA